MENFSKLADQQLERAKSLYIESLINKMIDEYLSPIQNAFDTYCQYEGLVYNDGISAIQLRIFPQEDTQYLIGVCATPHVNSEKFCKKHNISNEIIHWKTFLLTIDGIKQMVQKNQKIFEMIAFDTDIELTNLYSLPVLIDQIKNNNIKLTHITVKDGLND